MDKKRKVIIGGGGIIGLVMALELARQEINCSIIDPTIPSKPSKKSFGTRTAAILNPGLGILSKLIALSELKDFASPLKTMRIIDMGEETPQVTDFSSGNIDQKQFGLNIPLEPLRYSLYKAVKSSKHITYYKDYLDDYQANHNKVLVSLKGGQKLEGQILIAADGRRSIIREKSNIKMISQSTGQLALTAILNHSECHNNMSVEHHYMGGPMTFVPLANPIQSSLVWLRKKEDVNAFLSKSRAEQNKELRLFERAGFGAVSLDSKVQSWPMAICKAERAISNRIALIGETYHGFPPTGAQGLNLSLRDIMDLSQILSKAFYSGVDPGSPSVLMKYEHRRRVDVNTRIYGVGILNALVKTDQMLLQKFRRNIVKLLDTTAPLRKIVIRAGYN